jgi:hypothetical protein
MVLSATAVNRKQAKQRRPIMAKSIFDGPLTKEEQAALRKFIVHLFDFYKEYADDKYIHHLVYIAVRDITRIIGVAHKPLQISKHARKLLGNCGDPASLRKARKAHPRQTVQDHIKPAVRFIDEFKERIVKGKPFTEKDAARWVKQARIAVITAEENSRLGSEWRDRDRPDNAYGCLKIEVEDL